MYFTRFDSPLGEITVYSDGAALCALHLTGQKHGIPKGAAEEKAELLLFAVTKKWLKDYFDGRIPEEVPPLRLKGTQFQKDVWQALMKIPYGETLRYKDLAEQIAKHRGIKKMSAQAIGQAAGKNRILLLVPCHRLIGSDGSLTGFAAGIERKRWLLEHEGIEYQK